MIAGETLATWLADRGRQDHSHKAVEEFVGDYTGSELLGGLHRDIDTMGDPTPEALIAAARRFFDQVEARDDLLQALIARSRADPFFMPPFSPLTSEIHTALLIFNHPTMSIALGVTGVDMLAAKKAHRRGPASVGFTGVWNLFRYLKAGNSIISTWEAEPIEAGFSAATVGPCRLTGRRRLSDGEEILVDGSRETFIVDHADGDIMYLQAMIRTGAAPLTAEYDSDTMTFIGATSTDEASSRVQMMATLLREMDRADAIPLLREQLASPHFYTRWHIMREMLALDAEASLPDLKRLAAEDPHREVRAAAAQTLELFFPEEPETAEAASCHA